MLANFMQTQNKMFEVWTPRYLKALELLYYFKFFFSVATRELSLATRNFAALAT
jgi:hypothetical protein